MDLFGVSATLVATFVSFGLLIGILFGFFGMGGSFLVTPALLVMGYPSEVAVGSGLAFVFGTSVIATLKHRDLGQVDYKLGAMFVVGVTAGIEVGKRLVFLLKALGYADLVISVAYVVLLGAVGLFVLRDSLTEDDGDEVPALARRVQAIDVPPVVTLRGDVQVSVWVVGLLAVSIGVLSGFLGVGGGFLLMPSMVYGLGVPAAVAVGTDVFQITASGAFGAFSYASEGAVNLPVVASLLAGSAMGARIGSATTHLVDEDGIKVYFGLMLVGGSLAVAAKELAGAYDVPVLQTVSVALIVGSAVLVAGAVVVSGLQALRNPGTSTAAAAD
ncbi:MAG: sulfite exporter TauE/SafE family protein [Halobacteriaceae archaeon]